MIAKEALFRKLELFYLPVIVILVAVTAFGLGRLSVEESASHLDTPNTQPVAHTYIVSKNGTKYYLPSCVGASKIKEENKVWFATVADAQAAGYGPAANCPGL